MPGMVVFNRRWGVGSDDLVIPGAFLFVVHLIWIIALTSVIALTPFDTAHPPALLLLAFLAGYAALLAVLALLEALVVAVSLRGSILDARPRAAPMRRLVHARLAGLAAEVALLGAGGAFLARRYAECPAGVARRAAAAAVLCNAAVVATTLAAAWCAYDAAGRSWVKMKRYQRSMREDAKWKRSGGTRNWRQRKVLRAYQDSWQQRCRLLFCCMRSTDRNRDSFADIARLLSDFFRDLDVVPSDVVAGLVLLRKFQKIERRSIIEQRENDTYEFLSGVAVTPRTRFLALHDSGDDADADLFGAVVHFARFAVGAYGWPVYAMVEGADGLRRLCADLRCCGPPPAGADAPPPPVVVDDNRCLCNYAALRRLAAGDVAVVYATYHVDVGETPFYVAVDFDRKKVVVSVRGTLSMKDILTDLNAESETLPLEPRRDEWLGHKGMVGAAQYILRKLGDERLLERAFEYAPGRGTRDFKLVLVGHSLGAGTACILGILLRQRYDDLLCYCYSPPGGLLSMPAVEYTKSFTISVVIGKDVVPRIGLHQMEALRADLINAIKRSVDPKWKTIACSIFCGCGCGCGCGNYEPTSAVELSTDDGRVREYVAARERARALGAHPSDSAIALSSHRPLYPPGRIIHVVRHHPTKGEQKLSKSEPVYQALWSENTDFDEVLISPVMIQDHMPDKVLEALNKVITATGPRKPDRINSISQDVPNPNPNLRVVRLETCFASSSSPLPLADVLSLTNHNRQAIAKPFRKAFFNDDLKLAPLASPESLSEVSSVSSKVSVEMRTPLVMRRTPKIVDNLSTCADDIRNVRYFQRLGQLSRHLRKPSTNSCSNLSFQSETSKNSKNSDDLSDLLPNVAIDLNLSEENRSETFQNVISKQSLSIPEKNVTFNPEVVSIESSPPPKRPNRWSLQLPTMTKKVKAEVVSGDPSGSILCVRRTAPEAPGFGFLRKKYVYPVDAERPLGKDESSL